MNILKEGKVKIIKGSKDFEDDRGKISNYELTEPVNWLGLISSKAGCIRGNHYHPVQEQKVLLISGSYIGVYKDINETDGKTEEQLIKAGDVEIISPNIAHTMIFLEDSVFINLVKGEREHKNFGKHTIRFEVVGPNKVNDYISKYKNSNLLEKDCSKSKKNE